MGVDKLRDVIKEHAPTAIQARQLSDYSGKIIAIDVLIDFIPFIKNLGPTPTPEELRNKLTSHLKKLYDLTIMLLKSHIKPVYVFDGEPPQLKKGREDQISEHTMTYAREAKEMLQLMGIPYVEAESEAEAQCSDMVRCQKVYCAATIDMDALPFKTERVFRNLTFPNRGLEEINYPEVLRCLEFNEDEFVDMCILLGCSYCGKIPNIGAVKAYDFIKTYRSIENLIANIGETNYEVPQNWNYIEARKLYKNPKIKNSETFDLIWQDPNETGLINFLCVERQFNEALIRKGLLDIAQFLRVMRVAQ